MNSIPHDKPYDFCVFVGRFQGFHYNHLKTITNALTFSDKVLVIVGSYNTSPTIKNPFDFNQVVSMIRSNLDPIDRGRVITIPVRDYLYNDNKWVSEVQQKVMNATGVTEGARIALTGQYKDKQSYHLKMFPQWEYVSSGLTPDFIHATEVRAKMFEGDPNKVLPTIIPSGTMDFINTFKTSSKYMQLKDEYYAIKEYKESWANSPYPPTFTTVDTVVIGSGHVLVVTRKDSPGKGMLALPGGFIQKDETLLEASVRELKEETGLDINPSQVSEVKCFDHPDRSLRGRTLTHAHLINLGRDAVLPKVIGGDDAISAKWMPLADVRIYEDNFFEDHVSIIDYFTSKY